MNFRKLIFGVNKLSRKIAIVFFWILAVWITVIIVSSGLPFLEIVYSLGFLYLVLGIFYGIHRFLGYIFEE